MVVIDPIDRHVVALGRVDVVSVVLERARVDHAVLRAHHEDVLLVRVEAEAAAAAWGKGYWLL